MFGWFLGIMIVPSMSSRSQETKANIEFLRPLRTRMEIPDGVAIMEAALKKGADINFRIPDSGQTPLMHAILTGQDRYVQYILSKDPDVTLPEKDGYTPMHGAAFQGRHLIAQLLLNHGIPHTPKLEDWHTDGFAPIHRATWGTEKRHARTIEVLLRAGADPSLKSRGGKTPIDMCQTTYCRSTLSAALKEKAAEKKRQEKILEKEKFKEKMKKIKEKKQNMKKKHRQNADL